MRRTFTITTALLASAIALTGCSAMGGSESGSDRPVITDQGVPAPESADGMTTEIGGDVIDRQVITTGWVTIVVDDPKDAAAEAVRITEAAGGRIDGRSEYAPVDGDQGSATLTLRVPAGTLTATLDKLREIGEVREVSLNSSDVTMETQDLEARITALQASVDRLLALLPTATDTETLIALETALSARQADLESLKAQQRYLDDQVSMSTITLSLVSVAAAPVVEPDTFLSGLLAGWNAFVAFFAGLLVAFGVLLPWLVFAGLITLVILLLVRRARRKAAAAQPAAK
jgi:hypothetical protein